MYYILWYFFFHFSRWLQILKCFWVKRTQNIFDGSVYPPLFFLFVLLLLTLTSFFMSILTGGFYTEVWLTASLFRTLINLNNAVIWMVSILLLISSPFSRYLGTVPSAPTTNGITVTFMFFSFFCFFWQDPSICLSFRFLSFSLHFVLEQQNSLDNKFFFFFFFFFFFC